LRRATTYAINQRIFFRRCFSDGAFEIDNGLILSIDPRRYLQNTIDKLERGHALSRMSELTPASWAANQAR
jgi:hypothetical protein